MKKLFTLLFFVASGLLLCNNTKAQTPLLLDYDGMDAGYITATADTSWRYTAYLWDVNRNYRNDSSYTLRFGSVFYDTLINYDYTNNVVNTTYPLASSTVRLDSFMLYYNHVRLNTATTDSIYMYVFNINTATITGTGANAVFSATWLWRDSLKLSGTQNANTSGTQVSANPPLYLLTRRPNLTLPQGQSFGIYIEFRGNQANSLQMVASYRNECSNVCVASTAFAPDNSLYYLNLTQQGTNFSGINPVTFDCNQNLTLDNCELFYVQNFWLPAYVTLNPSSGGGCTANPAVTSGLYPPSDSVPCVRKGVSFSQTYTFVVPSTVATLTVNSMTIDSIRNLPTGLTYTFDQNPPTYPGGSRGCILVTGTTNAACGQYKILIYVTVNVAGIGNVSGELSALAAQYSIPGFTPPFLRVIDAAGTCPAVNNSQTANFVANASCGLASNLSVTVTKTDVNCFGQSTGSATATATGGTAPYTYAWSGGGNTATISNKSAGTYTVTVTDNAGGTATASITITQPASALSVTMSSTQTACGVNSGTATATAAGGTTAYTYLWSNSGTTATISNLAAGTYTVTVTDSKGCTATGSTTVSTPATFTLSVSTTNVTCYGQSTGSATANASGGSGFTYAWSNSGNTATISNLPAGIYSVTVTDGNGCVKTASGTVTQPANPLTATASSTPSSCGASTGTATVTVTNNVGTPTYAWNPGGGTTQTISNLAAGNYTVTVTAGGCTATAATSVNNSNGPSITIQKVDPTCFGSTNGSATALVSGGATPYTYLWSNNSTGSSVNGLAAGSYTLVVTDNSGCSAFGSFTLVQPNPLTLTETITNVNCNGGLTGAISLVVGGGTGPYVYGWSNSSTSSAISNLAAGNYTVTVTDSRSCTTASTYTVTQPTALAVTPSSTPSTGSNGTATATVSGGTSPYNYAWSGTPTQTTATATALAPGTYSVTVTDSKGCSATASVAVIFVGIEETKGIITNFSLFPNPANDKVNLVIDLEGNHSIQLTIADINGKVISSSKDMINGTLTYEIAVSDLTAGIYIVEATAERDVVRKRFVVIH